MFGRLAAVRIKAAESALADNRLEEALESLTSQELSGNRHAAKLLEKLADRLLERGQDALLGRRYAEALADFDLAVRCGFDHAKIEQWRRRAQDARKVARADDHDRDAAYAVAQQRLIAGSLAGATEALAMAPIPGEEGERIAAEITQQKERADQALQQAGSELQEGNVSAVVKFLHKARAMHSTLDGLVDMETKLVEHVLVKARESYKIGRLDRAEQDLDRLDDIGQDHSERSDMAEALRLARQAAKSLAEDRYAKAGVLLGRLAQIAPKAGWISDVRKHLRVLEEHRRQLLEGPLGLLTGRDVPSAIGVKQIQEEQTLPAQPRPNPAKPPVAIPAARDAGNVGRAGNVDGSLPRRLLLRVDGAGTFLLLRGDRLSIGRAGPGASASLQLISDLSERHAEIIRSGEDYFVVSGSGVELAGRPVDHALLQDGDRVRLGKRIRLKFSRQSLKSTTATLDLGDGVRTTTDCRRVILWSGPLLMGGKRDCHVKLSHGIGSWILLERGGRLYVKPMGLGGETTPVPLGEQIELGELRMTVHAWSVGSTVGKVIG